MNCLVKKDRPLKIKKKQQIFHLIPLHLVISDKSILLSKQNCERFHSLHSEHVQNIFPSVWAFMNMFPENMDSDHEQSSEKTTKGPT